MAPSLDTRTDPALALPPVFSARISDSRETAFDQACRLARGEDATGTLLWRRHAAIVDVAVVLAPEEPLASARRAFFACMVALAEAVGAHAPPEMPVVFDWPDTIRFDGARLGGGRLGWPRECGEDAVPDWLVFSAMIVASKAHAGDPGLTPDSTSLENEGFVLEDGTGLIVESFARHLMKAFSLWEEDGFAAIERRYLVRLAGGGAERRIDGTGDLIDGDGTTHSLVPALATISWYDPTSGAPAL